MKKSARLWIALASFALALPSLADVAPPIHLNLQALEDGLRVSWDAPAPSGIQGYYLYVKRPGTANFSRLNSKPLGGTSVKLKHLTATEGYEFAVSSVDSNGQESSMAPFPSAAAAPGLAPPSGFQSAPTNAGARLVWDRASLPTQGGALLYLADASGRPKRKLSVQPILDGEVTLSKLKPGKTYRFVLTALAPDGRESAPTAVVEVVPSANGNGGHENWYLELGGGADLPNQNWQSAYNLGYGGKLALGYDGGGDFSVQLDLTGFYFSGSNASGSITDIELLALPTLHYYLTNQGARPYLLAGAGAAFGLLTAPGGNATIQNLDVAGGLGLEVPLGGPAYVFAEGKYNLLFFTDSMLTDIPVQAGVRFGL